MTGLDSVRELLVVVPHDGYRQGEVPQFRECPGCHKTLRVDRTDLIAAHNRLCGVRFSEEELQLLKLLAAGYTNAELARTLRCPFETIETIKSRLKKLYKKLGVHGRRVPRAAAVAVALRERLID